VALAVAAAAAVFVQADGYIDKGLLTPESAVTIMRVIESERGMSGTINDVDIDNDAPAEAPAHMSRRLTMVEMQAELEKRIGQLQEGAVEGITDQWRVFSHVVAVLTGGERYLRLLVQASAGTGKSFLLSTVFLYCLVHDIKTKAAAPTGIAAASIEIEGTDVGASTIHALFDLDGDFQSKLDFAKPDHPKVKALLDMKMLLLDECSMLDVEIWTTIAQLCGRIDHSRRPDARDADVFGNIHLILFGEPYI